MSDIEAPLTISPPPSKKTITAFIFYPLILARPSRVPGDLELVTGVIRPRGSRIVFPPQVSGQVFIHWSVSFCKHVDVYWHLWGCSMYR